MKTILVVDDEKDIVDMVKYNLAKEGYSVIVARNGKQAIEQANILPDLILLDIMMPEHNGIEVIKKLKNNEKTKKIPVIFLTAKNADLDEVLGLELGADDYIVKPISIPKLIARIKKVLRKLEEPETTTSAAINVGPITILPANHMVRIGKEEIFFPKKEFEVLSYLAKHPDVVVNRETLLNAIWGSDVFVIERTVDVHIRKIREKLGKHADCIDTIKGVGYRMRNNL